MARQIYRENLATQLTIQRNNLSFLETQAAQYGMQVPVSLHNQIENAKLQIEEIQQKLANYEISDDQQVEIDIDIEFRELLKTIVYIQKQIDFLFNGYNSVNEKVSILWKRDHRSLRHRISLIITALLWLVGVALLLIKESYDILRISPILGTVIIVAIFVAGGAIYFVGRDTDE